MTHNALPGRDKLVNGSIEISWTVAASRAAGALPFLFPAQCVPKHNERAKEAGGDFHRSYRRRTPPPPFELFRRPDAWNNNKVAACLAHWPVDRFCKPIHYAYVYRSYTRFDVILNKFDYTPVSDKSARGARPFKVIHCREQGRGREGGGMATTLAGKARISEFRAGIFHF